jgi:hypothetical protein
MNPNDKKNAGITHADLITPASFSVAGSDISDRHVNAQKQVMVPTCAVSHCASALLNRW